MTVAFDAHFQPVLLLHFVPVVAFCTVETTAFSKPKERGDVGLRHWRSAHVVGARHILLRLKDCWPYDPLGTKNNSARFKPALDSNGSVRQ